MGLSKISTSHEDYSSPGANKCALCLILFTSRRKAISMSLDNQQIRLSQILSRLCILLREYEVATRVVRGGCTYPLGVTLRVSVNVFWENYLYVLGNCKCILPVTFQSRDTPPIDRRMKAHARGHVRREREKLREDTGRVAF